ncbi:unnamed protein product [Larinioides sclopetarius]|uniref:Fatty acid synthase n=1 Tax=Larinioides sclopetarius TaxID=280406 RepID=A0AAV2AKK6_9ARAC
MEPDMDHHEYCTEGFDPDDIVISGMAGRFPECETVGELKEGLYNKKNLIVFRDARFEKGTLDLPYSSFALLKELDKFDSEFFHCANTLADRLDPAGRIHMEVTYEAIADAGVDALDLKGRRIGIFNSTTADDCNTISATEGNYLSMASRRSMNPNRTSFVLGFTGPSVCIDTACSSTGVCLWQAVQSIRAGTVEAAVVSGCQVDLTPDTVLGYFVLGIMSQTGNSRPYDAKADGLMRGESVCAIFLQKAKVARRAYATIKASRFYSAGYFPEGIGKPSKTMQIEIMKDVLNDAKVDPDEVQFVEGHATGTPVGDPIEANAMDHVFSTNTRKKPLLLGSLKGNIGHTEACAGLCSVIKCLLAFENGLIPPNINYESPNPGSPALLEGKVSVVTESTPLTTDYIPVLSLGFGGTLAAAVLKKNPRYYEGAKAASSVIPRIVLFPATTESAINTVFDYVKNNPDLPEEFFALLSKLSFADPLSKQFRGYAVYQKGTAPVSEIKPVSPAKRQVWYVMTGMGCQWPGMGLQLMEIEEFAQSLKKSAEILKPYGIDLFEILRADKNYFQMDRKITVSFVAITSIQIALVDVLKLLGVSPDGILGHSFGELAAAYADGSCTHEQSLVASYVRGHAFESADLPEAGMAAIGVSWSQAQEMCPKDVYPACDNTGDSVTISGLKGPLEKFIEKLKQDNIPVTMVNSHGFGSHCRLVYDAAPLMKAALEKIIPDPKPRSERWISTSYPESEWNSTDCKLCGAEYFCNNLVSCVRFTDALKKIPSNAVVIEIGPHLLLQPILRRVVGSKASYHSLMRKDCKDSTLFFMESLGNLYNEGINPKIERLYKPVKFPVPRGTPMISDLIKWNHSQSFFVPKFSTRSSEFSREFRFDKEDAYLLDHKIDGKTIFPAAGFVYLAWEALAMKHQKDFKEMSIVIEDFEIIRTITTKAETPLKFFVNIQNSSGKFEILESKSLVASGKISQCQDTVYLEAPPEYTSNGTCVSGQDIYDDLRSSGFEYGPAFRSITECCFRGTSGLIKWQDRWISFLQTHVSMPLLIKNNKRPMIPTSAAFFKIDPNVATAYISENTSSKKDQDILSCNFIYSYNPKTHVCRSIGVEVGSIKWEPIPDGGRDENPVLEEHRFVPYTSSYTPTQSLSLQLSKYVFACKKLIKEIESDLMEGKTKHNLQIGDKTEVCIERIESLDGKDFLKVLETIFNNLESFKSKRKEFLVNYSRIAGKDILNNVLVNEESLKIMLEIISENSYKRLNVVEVNRNFPVALVPAIEIMRKYGNKNFKRSILIAPKSVVIDDEVLEEHGIQRSSDDSLKDFEKEGSHDVAVSSFTCGPLSELKQLLRSLTSIIKADGFILLFFKARAHRLEQQLSSLCGEKLQVHSVEELESALKSENLVILSKISDTFGGSLYLLRRPNLEKQQRLLLITDENNYEWVEKVKQELYGMDSGLFWLVAKDNPVSGILGMVNCLKQEPGGERIRLIFVPRMKNFSLLSLEQPLFHSLRTQNLVMNVWQNGSWGSYRHIPVKETKLPRPVEHSYVKCRKYGDLSSFEWTESRIQYAPRQNRKLVHIYYSAVNTEDVTRANGKLSSRAMLYQQQGNSAMGYEFSGREEGSGKRVCGFTPAGSMATSVLVDPAHCLEVPEKWTLEEAATVPVAYATCYYSLLTRAKLQPGESILIHSGSDGIGMAAITIALDLKCEVFTTVDNEEKRAFLRKKFPQIKNENIWSSRSISFENMVLSRTNGRGVNVILNTFVDDKFHANLRCIARSGRIIEIGKHNLALDRPKYSKILLKNVSFHGVSLDEIFDLAPKRKVIFQDTMDMIRKGIKTGVVKPLDRTAFDHKDIEDAFRYLMEGLHVGKVLLKMREEEPDKIASPKTLILPAIPETQFYYNKIYIVIGGLGGFGLEVTKWAISRGARNVVLTSRYGARTSYQHFCLKRWKDAGLNVRVSTLNVARRDEAEKLLKDCMSVGALGGIFNSAVILKDAYLDVQTPEDFQLVCGPKSEATKTLDELTRKLCPNIDYFVCFSSIVAGRGNAGQTNYAFANSVMERICEERRKDGLHGLAIQWGIIGDVGVVHRHMGDSAFIAGVEAQRAKSCLQCLDIFCQQDCPVVASYMPSEQSKKSDHGNILEQILKVLDLEAAERYM